MIYCLMEHKSSLDWRTPLQLLGYKVRILDRLRAFARGCLKVRVWCWQATGFTTAQLA